MTKLETQTDKCAAAVRAVPKVRAKDAQFRRLLRRWRSLRGKLALSNAKGNS
jgi:hypothetical protein